MLKTVSKELLKYANEAAAPRQMSELIVIRCIRRIFLCFCLGSRVFLKSSFAELSLQFADTLVNEIICI